MWPRMTARLTARFGERGLGCDLGCHPKAVHVQTIRASLAALDKARGARAQL